MEPTTAAGRELLNVLRSCGYLTNDARMEASGHVDDALPLIETEAVSNYLEAIARKYAAPPGTEYVFDANTAAEDAAAEAHWGERQRPALILDLVLEWLNRADGRLEDIFGLWVTGKRGTHWVAERLLREGHIDALREALVIDLAPSPPATLGSSEPATPSLPVPRSRA